MSSTLKPSYYWGVRHWLTLGSDPKNSHGEPDGVCRNRIPKYIVQRTTSALLCNESTCESTNKTISPLLRSIQYLSLNLESFNYLKSSPTCKDGRQGNGLKLSLWFFFSPSCLLLVEVSTRSPFHVRLGSWSPCFWVVARHLARCS